jgi:hypothetical protein
MMDGAALYQTVESNQPRLEAYRSPPPAATESE